MADMAGMAELFWLVASTQGLAWSSIFTYECWEKNRQGSPVIRFPKGPYCRIGIDRAGRRFFVVRGGSIAETIAVLLASSTFAQLTQEEQER